MAGEVLFAKAAEFGDDGEGDEFYERVADEIEEHGGVGWGGTAFGISREIGNGGEGYQDVASVRDRAVGEHALDVGLHQGPEVAGEHGEHGEHPEGPEPEIRGCGKSRDR